MEKKGKSFWEKKPKKDPKIQVHELEIKKLKLESELKKQTNIGIVSTCTLLLFFLILLLMFIA